MKLGLCTIQGSMMCVAEALLNKVLLHNLYGASGCHMSYFHYRVIIRVTRGCERIWFRTSIFSEGGKFVRFDIVALDNVYMYYAVHVGN